VENNRTLANVSQHDLVQSRVGIVETKTAHVSKRLSTVRFNQTEGFLRLLGSRCVDLAVFPRQIANLAGRRERSRAGRVLSTHERVEMGARVGACAVDGDTLGVDVEV